MKRLISILISILVSLSCFAQAEWEAPAAEDYESRTIVNYQLRVDGELVTSDSHITVAAFIGDECRGVSTVGEICYETAGGTTITYSQIDVYGGADDRGKSITFKVDGGETRYTLNNEIPYDEEVHGTLSGLEQFCVINLDGDEVSLLLDDIWLDVTECPRSGNLFELLRLQYYDRGLGASTEVPLSALPAYPEGFEVDWSSFEWLAHFTLELHDGTEAYLVATSGTPRDGEWIGGSIGWGYYSRLWFNATAFATPIDRLDYNTKMRVADIATRTGESIDLGDYITLLIPVYADDAKTGDSGRRHAPRRADDADGDDYDDGAPVAYDEVSYNDLATFLGHEVALHMELSVPEGYFYPNDYDSDTPNVYIARYPTTADGIEYWVWGGGTGLQLSNEEPGHIYIEPFDVLDSNVSIVMQHDIVIDLESTPSADLRDYMEVCVTDPETGETSYTPFHDFFDHFAEEHGYDPSLAFEWEENAHYSIGRDGCSIIPKTRTYSAGLPLRGYVSNVVGWRHDFDCQIYITPFERFDEYARIHLDDLYIERGNSVDIRDYITFEFQDGEGNYEGIPYRSLASELGYTPDLTFHWYFQNNGYYTIGDDSYTITGARSTPVTGTILSFYLDYKGFDNHTYAQTSTVYITPFDNFSELVEATLDNITLEYGTPADIRDYITFHIPLADGSGTLDVAFRDLEATLGSAPDFHAEADTRTDVYSLHGFVLTGNQPADDEPISIRLEALDCDFVYYADAHVTVTIPVGYTPIEQIAVHLPSGTGRFTTVSTPITLSPAGANYEISRFKAELTYPSSWDNAGWEAAEVTFDTRDGHPYISITPLVAGAIEMTVSYDDTDYLPSFWASDCNTSISLDAWADHTLETGWNWYTFYGLDSALPLADLDTQLFAGGIEDLRTQDAADYKDAEYGFGGYIERISALDCVKVKNIGATTTHYYQSHNGPASLKASTPIDIEPGWNWIPYPYQYTRSLRSLATYMPHSENDRIISRTDGFSDCDGEEWDGTLTALNPGEGYIYYNASDKTVRFTFPPEIQLPQPANVHELAHPDAPTESAARELWKKAAARSPHNMCIVAVVDGYHYDSTLADDAGPLSISAYVGQEYRGEGHIKSSDDGSRQWFFISLCGQPGEDVTLYLNTPAQTAEAEQTPPASERLLATHLTFQQSAGTLSHPIVLSMPTSIATTPADSADSVWYDLSGRRINRNATTPVRISNHNEKRSAKDY